MTMLPATPQASNVSVLRPLSKYHPPSGGILVPDISTIESLATISAGDLVDTGKKDKRGEAIMRPTPNRDGRISLHDPEGHAPGLRAVLQEREYKSLVIGFGQNDPAEFVRQRRALYSRGSLKIVGDETGLVEYDDEGNRHELRPDTEAFNNAWTKCSDETWLYFYLAAIDSEGPMLVCPDGVWVPYRLRFTSINSRRALDSLLRTLRDVGQYAIMPVLLQLDGKRPVVLPPAAVRERIKQGKPASNRGTAPVWSFSLMATSGTVRLNSRRLLEVRDQARVQSHALALSAPSEAVVRQALMTEGRPLADFSDDEVDLIARGGVCDSERWRRIWFQCARDTPAQTDEARHRFIAWYTKRHPELWQTDSLSEFLAHATDSDAAELVDALLALVDRSSGVNAEGEVTPPGVTTIEVPAQSAAPPPPPVGEDDTYEDNAEDVPLEALDQDDDEGGGAEVAVAAAAWVWRDELIELYDRYPTDVQPTNRERRAVGSVLLEAAGDIAGASSLLHCLTGCDSLTDITLGHVRVLVEASQLPSWPADIALLKRAIIPSEG